MLIKTGVFVKILIKNKRVVLSTLFNQQKTILIMASTGNYP